MRFRSGNLGALTGIHRCSDFVDGLSSATKAELAIGDLVDVASMEAGMLAVTREVGDPTQVVSEAVETFQAQASGTRSPKLSAPIVDVDARVTPVGVDVAIARERLQRRSTAQV